MAVSISKKLINSYDFCVWYTPVWNASSNINHGTATKHNIAWSWSDLPHGLFSVL